MSQDQPLTSAHYYDLQPSPFGNQDIAFYVSRLPGPDARVLELGCGTGRVLLPMAAHCDFICGVDRSATMLAVCQQKLAAAGLGPERARAQLADITRLDLGERFDLITAPFRVFQNMETDEAVDGFFETVRRHLAPGGRCILNAFRLFGPEAEVRARWVAQTTDMQSWEAPYRAGRVKAFERIAGAHPERFVVYPVLTYRYYEGETLRDEAVREIVMRAYPTADFEALIGAHGFRAVARWGGYSGEAYGEGPELVIEFEA